MTVFKKFVIYFILEKTNIKLHFDLVLKKVLKKFFEKYIYFYLHVNSGKILPGPGAMMQ